MVFGSDADDENVDEPVDERATANEAAALAYVRQLRPS